MNVVFGGNASLIFASGSNDTAIFRPTFWPTDIPDLVSWYTVDYGVYNTINTPAMENQQVLLWKDKSTDGPDAYSSSSTIALQPTFSGGAISFEVDLLSGQNPSPLNPPINYYVASKTILSGTASNIPIIKQGPTNLIVRHAFTTDTTGRLGARNNSSIYTTGAIMQEGKNVIACILSAPDVATIRKGNYSEDIAGLGVTTNTTQQFVIGSLTAGSALSPLRGSIYEILVYTGAAHTVNQQNTIMNYMAEKWGVTL